MNFGVQKKEREEKIAELMKEKGPIWKLDSSDDDVASINTNAANGSNGIKNGENPAPSLKDVIGTSLKYVGTYKKLDNTKQVVALIDDVIIAQNSLFFFSNNNLGCFVGFVHKLWQMLYGLCGLRLSSD